MPAAACTLSQGGLCPYVYWLFYLKDSRLRLKQNNIAFTCGGQHHSLHTLYIFCALLWFESMVKPILSPKLGVQGEHPTCKSPQPVLHTASKHLTSVGMINLKLYYDSYFWSQSAFLQIHNVLNWVPCLEGLLVVRASTYSSNKEHSEPQICSPSLPNTCQQVLPQHLIVWEAGLQQWPRASRPMTLSWLRGLGQ